MPVLLIISVRSAQIEDMISALEWQERDHQLYFFLYYLQTGHLCFALFAAGA